MSEQSTSIKLCESEETDKVIKQHACMAGGATLAAGLVPGTGGWADVIIMTAILYGMYTRINANMHVAFTKNKVQSIAKMVGANVVGNIAGFLLIRLVTTPIRYIPVLHFAGAAVDAGANATIMYICGKLYKTVIANLQGSGREISETDVQTALEEALKNKAMMSGFRAEAKKDLKGTKYSDYKDAAKAEKEAYEKDPDLTA